MARLFEEHRTRATTRLDGMWDFCFLEGVAAAADMDAGALTFQTRDAVPGCFDTHAPLLGKRGTGAYHRRAVLGEGTGESLLTVCTNGDFPATAHWLLHHNPRVRE